MSVTQTKWDNEQCRVENGIFFSDDSVILLSGNPRDGYAASGRTGLSPLLESDPEGWTDLIENHACRTEAGGVIAVAGEGASEGEGFVATLRASDGGLLWVLHLDNSEAFREVCYDGIVIQAVSSEWPDEYRWRIPLGNPWSLSMTARRAV